MSAPVYRPSRFSAIPREDRRPLPAEPTDTQPGSAARVKVYEARRAAGLRLFHPGDARGTAAGAPERLRDRRCGGR